MGLGSNLSNLCGVPQDGAGQGDAGQDDAGQRLRAAHRYRGPKEVGSPFTHALALALATGYSGKCTQSSTRSLRQSGWTTRLLRGLALNLPMAPWLPVPHLQVRSW